MAYSKREILKAGELAGQKEVAKNIVQFLDEAKALYRKEKTTPVPTKLIIEAYHDWFTKLHGIPPNITSADGAMAKQIATYLKDLVTKRNPLATDETVIQSWVLILQNYNRWDKFLQRQV